MNALDIAVIVILAFFILKGLFRGFIKEVLSILGLVLAFFAATQYYDRLALELTPYLGNPSWRNVTSFVLVFFGVYLAVGLIGLVLDRLVTLTLAKPLNMLAGALVGLVKGAFLSTLIFFVVAAFVSASSPLLTTSLTWPYFKLISRAIAQATPSDIKDRFEAQKKSLPEKFKEQLEERVKDLPELNLDQMRDKLKKS